ncbi:MAG TPA: hypothetical protein PLD62_08185, partial [Candidatus Cloacimonadota bacterium]|nr:hypothetical protein [Candidatus Cloacimonadota bacterium]
MIILTGCLSEVELKIYNNTPIQQTAKIDGIVYILEANGEPAVETYYLTDYLVTSETVKVQVEYVANSSVSFRSPKTFKVEMKAGKDRTFHIKYDRGQVEFRNISSVTICQVLLQEIGADDWTTCIFEGEILPDEIEVVAAQYGNFKMKIIDH